MLKSNPGITDCSPEVVMEAMEKLAVIPAAKSVSRAELMKMSQGSDESIRTFAAKVQGKAQTCGFVTKFKCTCEKESSVNYTQEIIKDVLLSGIADVEIQTTVFDVEGIEEKSVNEIVALIERKEKARKAYHHTAVSALSSFKRSQNPASKTASHRKQPPKPSPRTPCPKCKRPYRKHNGRNVKPFDVCIECFRGKRGSIPSASNNMLANASDSDESTAALLQDKPVSSVNVVQNSECNVSRFVRAHCERLCSMSVRDHPRINLCVRHLGGTRRAPVVGIADTGAQSNVWGMSEFLSAGFKMSDLKPCSLKITAANKQRLPVAGGFMCCIEGDRKNGEAVSCIAMVYVSEWVSGLFVSFDTLIKLGVVSKSFPEVGVHSMSDGPPESPCPVLALGAVNSSELVREINSGCLDNPCDCPQRSAVPSRPDSLPFQAKPENVEKMGRWLLNYFKASTF
ncbi:MAG: hypothetical protein AAFO91_10025, partial [Bacteroidota bacterium]